MSLITAFAVFTSPVDAATRIHEINFHENVPCVGETIDLDGPFHITLTFSADKSLTNVEVSVQGIRGTGENTHRTYSADQGNKNVSTPSYTVRNGVGRGNIIVTFQVVGRSEGNSGNVVRFWAKQIVRVEFGKNLKLDFESLKVCVTP
jgi:hypothetical protein